MRLVFLGPPGVGKGTQSAVIAKKHAVPHIATGDILRKAICDETEVGLEAKSYIDAGKLVPDEVIIQVMNDRLQVSDAAAGYILDGYPRTIVQGDALARFLLESEKKIDHVFYLGLDEAVLVKRISGRRLCPSCQTIYHILHNKPTKDGQCECGTSLIQRKDDHEDTVKNRLFVYEKETAPLIEYYKKQDILVQIDADGSLKLVSEKIEKILKESPSLSSSE